MAEPVQLIVNRSPVELNPNKRPVEILVHGRGMPGKDGLTPVFAETIHEFPNIGTESAVYICRSENALYRWSDEMNRYVCIGRDYTEIEIISGGEIINGE